MECRHKWGHRGPFTERGWGIGGGGPGGGGGRGRFSRGMDEQGGGRHGGRRRMFESGELRLVLLRLLEDQPRHGYDFIRELEARTGGAYAPSPGVVYPTLALLADLGFIVESETEGAKRLFNITDSGRRHLDERRAEADSTLAKLAELNAEQTRLDAAPVRRAMQNLRMALHQRLAHEGATKQNVFDIAAALDEAAAKIERL